MLWDLLRAITEHVLSGALPEIEATHVEAGTSAASVTFADIAREDDNEADAGGQPAIAAQNDADHPPQIESVASEARAPAADQVTEDIEGSGAEVLEFPSCDAHYDGDSEARVGRSSPVDPQDDVNDFRIAFSLSPVG